MHQILNFSLLLGALAVFCGGCGSTAYQEKFAETLKSLGNEQPFHQLLKTSTRIPIPGSREALSLRLPKFFDARAGNTYALDARTRAPEDPEIELQKIRWLPKFLDASFLEASKKFDLEHYHLRTYEARVDATNLQKQPNQGPLHCVIFAVPNGSLELEDLKANLAEAMEKQFPQKPVPPSASQGMKFGSSDWERLSVRTPEGTDREVERLKGEGNYKYLAECLVYLIPVSQFDVVIVWLTTFDRAQQLQLDVDGKKASPKDYPLARALAGTVQIVATQEQPLPPAD